MELKSIILFNQRDQTYTIIGRNYTEDDAKKEMEILRAGTLPAYTIEQHGHFSSDKDVEKAVSKIMNKAKNSNITFSL